MQASAQTQAEVTDTPRHSLVVRITHWITAFCFFGLLISGVAILLAHPRLYWGETGAVGTPSLIDLPLPFVLTGQSGWGRSLHFLSAWVCVLAGIWYFLAGVFSHHFRGDLLPGRQETKPPAYTVVQRLAYSGVVFLLFPLIILSGLAMSPAITSVVPALVIVFGGQQSARTIHFFLAASIALFFAGHVTMVGLAGFTKTLRGMITGRTAAREEHA